MPVLGPPDRAAESSAASATSGVSTGIVPLEPKAPPTSGTTTRIEAGSRPRICASCARGRYALCEDDQTVNRSPSATASAPRGSIGTAANRGITCSVRITCAAALNAPTTSPSCFSQRTSVSPARGSVTASSGS